MSVCPSVRSSVSQKVVKKRVKQLSNFVSQLFSITFFVNFLYRLFPTFSPTFFWYRSDSRVLVLHRGANNFTFGWMSPSKMFHLTNCHKWFVSCNFLKFFLKVWLIRIMVCWMGSEVDPIRPQMIDQVLKEVPVNISKLAR